MNAQYAHIEYLIPLTSRRATMATALTLIVLGHVFNNMTVMSRNGSTIDSGPNVKEVLPDQLLELQTKRYNYT